MWQNYIAPRSLDEALALLAEYGERCRPIAGGTDLILEIERGLRSPELLVDLSRLPDEDRIWREGDSLHIGALATHNDVVACRDVRENAFPLARASWLVGAPQIRNRGTIAGNLVTASPANDTITALWAMDATLILASHERGKRQVRFDEFFRGVRRNALAPDELLVEIQLPVLGPHERGTFLKLGLRQAMAISVINVAVVVAFDTTPGPEATVIRARIALGSVAPTIVRASEAEAYLRDRRLTPEVIHHAAGLASASAKPITDLRASADYRREMIDVFVARALHQLLEGSERQGFPAEPVTLWGLQVSTPSLPPTPAEQGAIEFTVNGRAVTLRGVRGKTLLRALREDLGLTGAKEGCAEGECGACTVWLDDLAVMSCLVPVERVAGCSITTVEGLASADGALHPVQHGFVEAGATQCGYCTPGFVMSAASLLDEISVPTSAQIREALTGNLCRCTGYYKIIEAVEHAVELRQKTS